jgi:hypothetical protein
VKIKYAIIAELARNLESLKTAETFYKEIEKTVLFSLFGYRPSYCAVCVLKAFYTNYEDGECVAQKYKRCSECRKTCPLPEKE